jgi:ectoine hydroxylase-related dioxygenase (phytanoyl-CoA dioxygenase family)
MYISMKQELLMSGFTIVQDVFSTEEIERISHAIDKAVTLNPIIQKSADLFAIRQFFSEVPAALEILSASKLPSLIADYFGSDYFIVKSIYFDKPPASNWFVSYHQDLTISVDRRMEISGFDFWTVKQNQFYVRPPLAILEDNFTVRIHLDSTTKENGALKVIPGSHLKGVLRSEDIRSSMRDEVDCEVPKGGIMLMKPLLMHSSGRTTNERRRRVLHIEYSRQTLPHPLNWAEKSFASGKQVTSELSLQ